MIETTTILTHTLSFILGCGVTYTYFHIRNLIVDIRVTEQRLDDIEKSILTPEEMAKQILSMKIPIKGLPPEVLENIRAEAEELNKRAKIPSYMG